MKTTDYYQTIAQQSNPIVYKDKHSKFIGYAIPVNHEDLVKLELEKLKKTHSNAQHWCYAYQIGHDPCIYRVNDDGEPNNSAGLPIYGQIKSYGLTNILIVVVRYFGGTKLGVGGLINAYKSAAKLAIEGSQLIEKTIAKRYQLEFEYKHMSKIMHFLKRKNIVIVEQKLKTDVNLVIDVRKSMSSEIFDWFSGYLGIVIKEL